MQYSNTKSRNRVALLKNAKMQLVQASTRNTTKRLNQVIDTVQKSLPSTFEPFIINKNNMKQIFQDIKTCILSWKGNEINCSTQNGYTQASIQWFTKNNAKIYGNCLFYPVFIHILNFCNQKNGLDNNTKIHLFLSIMQKILSSHITTIGCIKQPLVPIQCLLYPNKFKTILKQFINHFYIECNVDNIDTIIQSLHKIEDLLLCAKDENVVYNLFTIKHSKPMLRKNESKSADSETSVDMVLSSSHRLNNHSNDKNVHQNNMYIRNIGNVNNSNQNQTMSFFVNGNNSNGIYSQIPPQQLQQHVKQLINVRKNNNNGNKVKLNTSITVPLNKNQTVDYRILSFNPLVIEKVVL